MHSHPQSSSIVHSFVGFDQGVVVDLETTGLSPQEDRVVSVSCLKGSMRQLATDGGADLDAFCTIVNPGVPIPADATAVHGITDQQVDGAPPFEQIALHLRQFIGALPLIGHNVSFDKAFLSAEFQRAGQPSVHRNCSFCTMKRLREYVGSRDGEWRNLSLDESAARLGLQGRKKDHHDATEDAELALEIAAVLYRIDNELVEPSAPLGPPKAAHVPISYTRAVAIIVGAVLVVIALVFLL